MLKLPAEMSKAAKPASSVACAPVLGRLGTGCTPVLFPTPADRVLEVDGPPMELLSAPLLPELPELPLVVPEPATCPPDVVAGVPFRDVVADDVLDASVAP